MQIIASNHLSFFRVIRLFAGLLGAVIAMTILYLGMRAVMDVGGYCAEGGAYQIAVHCPKGVAILLPLSIFLGLGCVGVYAFSIITSGPNITSLFWTGLFTSLGWNFLEFGMKSGWKGDGVSWLICAVMFFVMGLWPLFFLEISGWKELLGIQTASTDNISPAVRIFLVLLHIMGMGGGIYLGLWIYQVVAYT